MTVGNEKVFFSCKIEWKYIGNWACFLSSNLIQYNSTFNENLVF